MSQCFDEAGEATALYNLRLIMGFSLIVSFAFYKDKPTWDW